MHSDPHRNACAQVAAAAILAKLALGPYAFGARPDERVAVGELLRTHPPDMPLGLGTTAFRFAALLRAHGLAVRIVHGGAFGWAESRALAEVAAHVAAGGPVAVCIDDGLLGGRAFEAHWALLEAIDRGHVALSLARSPRLPLARFLQAWRCRALPYTHNACALLIEPNPAATRETRLPSRAATS